MIAVSLIAGQRAAWRGENAIKLRSESGKPAMVKEDDAPIAFETLSGEGAGQVESIGTYEESGITGTLLEVNVGGLVPTASVVRLRVDRDNDAGEISNLDLEFNLTIVAEEAAAFDVPAPVIETIPA